MDNELKPTVENCPLCESDSIAHGWQSPDMIDRAAVAEAVQIAEQSLLQWTDAAWNRTVAGDARDFCRAQHGRFQGLRDDLGLPPYKRPEFQEGELPVKVATEAMQKRIDAMAEALRKARDRFQSYGDLHKAKGTREADQKAAVNWAMAMEMDEALTQHEGDQS